MNPSDTRLMLRDFALILGFPAVIIGILAYAAWPWGGAPYAAPSQEAFLETVAGVWDWDSDSSCVANPQRIAFSDDRARMILTMRRRWALEGADSTRVAVYALSDRSPSHVRGAILGETRTTDDGTPVAWDLILESEDAFAWHRTDWEEGATTASLHRCPASADAVIPPLTDAERAALPVEVE